ncbi:unnamed protein product, partial [marine sediment metagenome]
RELDQFRLAPEQDDYDNRDRMNGLFLDQDNYRSRNVVIDLGGNWSGAVQPAASDLPSGAAKFNEQWLDKNGLYNPAVPAEPGKDDEDKGPPSGKPSGAWQYFKGKKSPAPVQIQPGAPEVAQGKAMIELAESLSRQQADVKEGGRLRRDRQRDQAARYQEKLQQQDEQLQAQLRIAERADRASGRSAGIVVTDGEILLAHGDRADQLFGRFVPDESSDGPDGQPTLGPPTGVVAPAGATGLASLKLQLPDRDEFYRVYRFTTPRGEVK